MNALALVLVAWGYRHAWVFDSEFRQPWGERPTPHCIVAHCVITGEWLRLWVGDDPSPPCPFALDRSELFIAYAADAEVGCFLQLGWPPPLCILDLYPEFLRLVNGHRRRPERKHDGLIDALAHFGEPSMGAAEKDEFRALAIRGGPYTDAEKKTLLEYCETDVEATERLLYRMWSKANLDDSKIFNQALWRGRYQAAVAAIRAIGVPIDVSLLKRLVANWGTLKAALIKRLGGRYDVYVDGSFNHRRFKEFLAREELLTFWPRLASGALATDEKTFSDMAKLFPVLDELRQLLHIMGKLRLIDLEIGQDGRNRFYLAPFRTKTSRNAPSNSRFIFGPFAGLRNLIRAPEGHAIAYCDWNAQEFGIAAARSGDGGMWNAYATGDPHIAFAQAIGKAPAHATRKTHAAIRETCKSMNFGILYGMTDYGLVRRANISVTAAENLMRRHRALYPQFWRWSDRNIEMAMLGMPLTTRLGWTLEYPPNSLALASPRTAQNYPVQANAAELMRYAAIRATEAGLKVCCPVHDAFLIEGSLDEIGTEEAPGPHVELLRTIMGDASEAILGAGYRIRADVKIRRWPETYRETRGLEIFNILVSELARIEGTALSKSSDGLEALEAVEAIETFEAL